MSTTSDIATNPYRADFPLLANNPTLAFLDSAATAQRPTCVLDKQRAFYETMNANPLRGLYRHSVNATEAIEKVRAQIMQLTHAGDEYCVVFCRNTSEALNLVAKSYAPLVLGPGDEVAITIMEHHSNLIPWQQVCRETGAKLVYLYPDHAGMISEDEIARKITSRTKIVSCAHVSNVMGCELPVRKLADAAHAVGAVMVVDAAQSLPHMPLDINTLGADFLAFSAHKALGPMGVGVLLGRRELLDQMPPMLTGGEMIDSVTEQDATWAPLPEKFEAGTQDAAGIYGAGVGLDYLTQTVGYDTVQQREAALVAYAMQELSQFSDIDIIGSPDASKHHGVVSFNLKGVHPHDVASILDMSDVAIRAGHHCAQPLLTWLGVENLACCRASFAFYNDKNDVDRFIEALDQVRRIFNG